MAPKADPKSFGEDINIDDSKAKFLFACAATMVDSFKPDKKRIAAMTGLAEGTTE